MPLDLYDDKPRDMKRYLSYYGWHFNKKMLEFAVSYMKKNELKISPLSKLLVDDLLTRMGITIDNNQLYDYVYVANMCKADFYGSSITSELEMALYIKDVIDDEDSYDGRIFSEFYLGTVKKGIPIDWEEML